MVLCLLAAINPGCHLKILVLPIGRTVHVLGQVDVQAFHLFRIIVVSSAEKDDRSGIVKKAMDLR